MLQAQVIGIAGLFLVVFTTLVYVAVKVTERENRKA